MMDGDTVFSKENRRSSIPQNPYPCTLFVLFFSFYTRSTSRGEKKVPDGALDRMEEAPGSRAPYFTTKRNNSVLLSIGMG
jgi:hypothetical protein